MNKPQAGLFKKIGVPAQKVLKEFKLDGADAMTVGQVISCDVFQAGDKIDVTGISKGHGFTGVIKRWNQSRGPETHGSTYHRRVGSMGTMRPMRVLKGKKLPGHLGNETITIQNLMIVDVDTENKYILVSGNVPGAKNSFVFIREAIKGSKYAPVELISYETELEEETVENVGTEEVVENNVTEVAAEETTNSEEVTE